jgi:hypothetical protein
MLAAHATFHWTRAKAMTLGLAALQTLSDSDVRNFNQQLQRSINWCSGHRFAS